MSGAVEAGNKVLVNVGLVEFFGKQRSRWSRLLATVLKDERSAMIEPYLDWQAGDQLYFAPTAMQADHSDYLTIESYNRDTGELRLTEPESCTTLTSQLRLASSEGFEGARHLI